MRRFEAPSSWQPVPKTAQAGDGSGIHGDRIQIDQHNRSGIFRCCLEKRFHRSQPKERFLRDLIFIANYSFCKKQTMRQL